MSSQDDSKNIFTKGEEFLQVFKKGAEFTQELLKQNEVLRYKVVSLEDENSSLKKMLGSSDIMESLKKRISDLEVEKEELLSRFREVEAENKDFAARYIEVEHENNNLANLYIASYQLHSTLDFKEVLQIILEIVINLIGTEEFGILLTDEKTHQLYAVATEGIDKEQIPLINLGEGIIGKVAKTGENYFKETLTANDKFDHNSPIACIPLKIKEHIIGVLVIYKLLVQKQKFEPIDYELFTLLAGHAATAVFSSDLYSRSERRLSTIQGFIELLSK